MNQSAGDDVANDSSSADASEEGGTRTADRRWTTRFVDRVQRLLLDSRAWVYIATIHALMLVKSGLWEIPNLLLTRQVAENPFVNPFADPFAHYLFWSWLAPWLAWLVGATGETSFFLFNLAFLVAFNIGVVWLLWRDLPPRSARLALLAFAALPVSTTVWFWLSTDALTLCLLLAAVAWRRHWLLMPIIGVLLGLQHFEQGFIAAMLLLAVAVLNNGWRNVLRRHDGAEAYVFPVRSALGLAVGTVIGKFVLIALFAHYDIVVNSGRSLWLAQYWRILVWQYVTTLPFALWSVFGVGWLLVVRFLDRERWSHAIAFAIVVFPALLLLLPIVGDVTRVAAIVSFPIVMASILLNQRLLAEWPSATATRFLMLWVAVPWIWVGLGGVQLSKFPDDVQWLRTALGG